MFLQVSMSPSNPGRNSSADFAKACTRWKVRQSMGRVGSRGLTSWSSPEFLVPCIALTVLAGSGLVPRAGWYAAALTLVLLTAPEAGAS